MAEQRARLLIRIPVSLKKKLVEVSQRERRSLNKQIEFLLERSVARDDATGSGSSKSRKSH